MVLWRHRFDRFVNFGSRFRGVTVSVPLPFSICQMASPLAGTRLIQRFGEVADETADEK